MAKHKDLEKAVHDALAALATVKRIVDEQDFARLTADERKTINGRMRTEEDSALVAVFDTVDAFPGHFMALADKDGGKDPKKVETEPSRSALTRRMLLAPLSTLIEEIGLRVSDELLVTTADAKDFAQAAYAIAKANAPSDEKLRKAIAPALDFYARQARRGAPKAATAK